MTDTPAHVEQRYRDMLMRRSGSERLRMGSAMFETARTLVRASLGDPRGTDNSADMRARMFLRIYGQDFDAPTAACIAAHLRGDGAPERSATGASSQ